MKVVINVAPDLEMLLVEHIRDHLYNEVHYPTIFPNFPGLRISNVHPFAFLIDNQINSTPIPVDLFPSITLVDESDSKDSLANMSTLEEETKIQDAEIADIDADPNRVHYIISPTDFALLKAEVGTDVFPFAVGSSQRRKSSIVCEVWDRNAIVKNRIYDLLRNYFIHRGRYLLRRDHDIVITEDSISGQKSGNYNFDFGYTIYGATMRMDLSYIIAQYFVDDTIVDIASITHSIEEVHNA